MLSHTPQAVIAIDIGGTKIAAGFVHPDQPTTVHAKTTRPTLAQQGPAAVEAQLREAIAETIAAAQAENYEPIAIGAGAPGVVDASRGVVVSAGDTMPGWAGTNVVDILHSASGLPAAVVNDVRVMGLGEAVHGAGKGIEKVLFVSLGTGIGGAIVTNGCLGSSPHHNRGEIAYLLGPTPDGGMDIIEKIGSGPSLTRYYRQETGCGEDVDLREIMRRYHEENDAVAQKVLQENLYCVGQALAGLITCIDTSAVIVGGGVATIGDPVMTPLTQGIVDHLLPGAKNTTITRAQLGTDAPLVGAAYLAYSHYQGEQ